MEREDGLNMDNWKWQRLVVCLDFSARMQFVTNRRFAAVFYPEPKPFEEKLIWLEGRRHRSIKTICVSAEFFFFWEGDFEAYGWGDGISPNRPG